MIASNQKGTNGEKQANFKAKAGHFHRCRIFLFALVLLLVGRYDGGFASPSPFYRFGRNREVLFNLRLFFKHKMASVKAP